MRVRFWHLITLALILGVAYMLIFEMDTVKSWFHQAEKAVKGYKEATTPEEALEYFNKAMEAHDYDIASDYLAGEYASRFKKVAPAAAKLAKAIDNIRSAMDTRDITRKTGADAMLTVKEPFPKKLALKGTITKLGDNQAVATVLPENFLGYQGAAVQIAFVKDKDSWRINGPLASYDLAWLEGLERFAIGYAKAIDKVDEALKGKTMTDKDVIADLKVEFREVERP